jgi:hypothetical protein
MNKSAKPKLTDFVGEPEFSDNQRTLGHKLYNSDNDMKLRKYVNGKPQTVAIFEAKHGFSEKIDLDDSNIISDKIMCDEEFKIPIPHFIVVYYLKPSFQIPMYYIIGNNKTASSAIKNFNNGRWKYWFSEEDYSKFQHFLVFQPFEEVGLSSTNKEYKIPQFIYSKANR